MDEKRKQEWIEALERPIWESLEEVYDCASLSEEERAALSRYKRVAEHHLLRAKRPEVTGIGDTPIVRQLAGFLRFLNSGLVVGSGNGEPPRQSFVNEMFGGRARTKKSVHGWRERKVVSCTSDGRQEVGSSLRSFGKSSIFWDKLEELRVLAFFCANGIAVELPSLGQRGKKPEFFIYIAELRYAVEVKNVSVDDALDKVYGTFEEVTDYILNHESTEEFQGPGRVNSIVDMVNRQYESAVGKFGGSPGIVFISVVDTVGLREHLDTWAVGIRKLWSQGNAGDVAAVVLRVGAVVQLIQNARHKPIDTAQFGDVALRELSELYEVCDSRGLWPAR